MTNWHQIIICRIPEYDERVEMYKNYLIPEFFRRIKNFAFSTISTQKANERTANENEKQTVYLFIHFNVGCFVVH